MSLAKEIQEIINKEVYFKEGWGIEGEDKATDEILKLIEKHGYRKVEVMDGYWSD